MPVSGAWQLKTRGAIGLRPMISQSGVYSRLREPGAVLGIGQEQIPEPDLLRLGADLLHDRRLEVRIARSLDLLLVDALGRVDVLVHEALELLLDRLASVGRFEVHRVFLSFGSSGIDAHLDRAASAIARDVEGALDLLERETVGDERGERVALGGDHVDGVGEVRRPAPARALP